MPQTNDPVSDEPLMSITGSQEAAAHLRNNLVTLAAQHHGTRLGRLLEDVLCGRTSPRALHQDGEFAEVVRTGVGQYREFLASLTPQQRTEFDHQSHDGAEGSSR